MSEPAHTTLLEIVKFILHIFFNFLARLFFFLRRVGEFFFCLWYFYDKHEEIVSCFRKKSLITGLTQKIQEKINLNLCSNSKKIAFWSSNWDGDYSSALAADINYFATQQFIIYMRYEIKSTEINENILIFHKSTNNIRGWVCEQIFPVWINMSLLSALENWRKIAFKSKSRMKIWTKNSRK